MTNSDEPIQFDGNIKLSLLTLETWFLSDLQYTISVSGAEGKAKAVSQYSVELSVELWPTVLWGL